MKFKGLRLMWGRMMQMRRRVRTPEPPEEKKAFEAAIRESAESQEYARKSIAKARGDMIWMEDALSYFPPDRNLSDWGTR